MRLFIALLLSFNLVFLPCSFVFASDISETETNTFSDFTFTLYDVLYGKYLEQFKEFYSEYWNTETGGFDTDKFIKDTLYPCVSAVVACTPTTLDDLIASLMTSEPVLKNVIIDPVSRLVNYKRPVFEEIEKLTDPLIKDPVMVNNPVGFYACLPVNYYNTNFNNVLDYRWFYSNLSDVNSAGTNTFFTNVGGLCVACSFASEGGRAFVVSCLYSSSLPSSHAEGTRAGYFPCTEYYFKGDKAYCYGARGVGAFGLVGDFNERFPQVYSSADDAVKAFYGFTPHEELQSNGNGYVRNIVKKEYNISRDNIFKIDWKNQIIKNYNDYGDSFQTTIFNSYQFIQPSADTPDYVYNQYTDDVLYPSADYNLDDITLSDPSFSNDNTFITNVFNSIPLAVSGLLLSIFLLSAVIIFLRG